MRTVHGGHSRGPVTAAGRSDGEAVKRVPGVQWVVVCPRESGAPAMVRRMGSLSRTDSGVGEHVRRLVFDAASRQNEPARAAKVDDSGST